MKKILIGVIFLCAILFIGTVMAAPDFKVEKDPLWTANYTLYKHL